MLPESVERILEQKDYVGLSGKVMSSAANSTRSNLEILHRLFLENSPRYTLEIGLAFAASAALFCELHKSQGFPGKSHYAMDPFQETVWDSVGLKHLDDASLSGQLEFISEYSSLALPRLLLEKMNFDLIYIDGSHIFEDVFVDFYFSSRLLSPGGIIVFDDSSDRHVLKVIRFIRNSLNASFTEIDLDPYQNFSSRAQSLKYAVGRRLGKVQCTAFKLTGSPERSWDAPFHDF